MNDNWNNGFINAIKPRSLWCYRTHRERVVRVMRVVGAVVRFKLIKRSVPTRKNAADKIGAVGEMEMSQFVRSYRRME